jgi:tetrahydromethanopterin S-methyltransferase subunit E
MAEKIAAARERSAAELPAKRRDAEPELPVWADSLTRWLDDAVRIPGTNIGIGLDPVLGFLAPGLGDAATGVVSLGLLFLALRSRVPRVVLGRMLLNLLIDALVGAVPIVGDVFDVAWRANRKNLELIKRHGGSSGEPAETGDYLLVVSGVFVVLLAVALPIVIAFVVGAGLFHRFSAH